MSDEMKNTPASEDTAPAGDPAIAESAGNAADILPNAEEAAPAAEADKFPATEEDTAGGGEATEEETAGGGEAAEEAAPTDGEVDFWRGVGAWISNFWYHHKFGTCVVVFLLIASLFLIPPLFGANQYDTHILYAGPWFECSRGPEASALDDAIKQVMPDYDNNGEKNLSYRPIFLINEQQIEDLKAEYAGREEDLPYINPTLLQQNSELFDSELMTGEAIICFLDVSLFLELKNDGWVVSLTDPVEPTTEDGVPGLGIDPATLPAENFGGYGVYVKDTEFGQFFTGVKAMPENTVLCIRRTSMLTGTWMPEVSRAAYINACDLIYRILEFKAPEAE